MSDGPNRVGSPPPHDGDAQDQRSRPVEWVLLEGNRWLVAGGVLASTLVLLVGFLISGLASVADSDALTRGFAALIGGNMTLITIVISINQLVLSREFGTPAELQDRIDEMMDYRKEAEETVEVEVSPVTPSAFLDLLSRSVRDHALSLADSIDNDDAMEPELRTDMGGFVDTVVEDTERAIELPEEPPTEAFPALLTILDVDFTGYLQRARWFRRSYGPTLPETANNSLDNLCELFQLIGVLRQYLETLYLQRELALLSRRLFYVGIPAIVLSLATIWVYGHPSGATLGSRALQYVVTISAVIAFAPLTVFFAFVLRIATITRRTAGLLPFNVEGRNSG